MKKYLFLLLICVAMLVGCNKKDDVSSNKLVGTWNLTEYAEPEDDDYNYSDLVWVDWDETATTLTFAEDGYVTAKGVFGNGTLQYQLYDDNFLVFFIPDTETHNIVEDGVAYFTIQSLTNKELVVVLETTNYKFTKK